MPEIVLENGKKMHVDGFISNIALADGRVFGLRSSIIEVKPITCKKCGGSVTLKYGEGTCDFCKT